MSDALGNVRSIVFYCGESANVKRRIEIERRLDNAGMRSLAMRVIELIEDNHLRTAVFEVRFSPHESQNSAQNDILAQYDYSCNNTFNGDLRIEEAIEDIFPADYEEEEEVEEEEEEEDDDEEDEDEEEPNIEDMDLEQMNDYVEEQVAQVVAIMEDLPDWMHDHFKDLLRDALDM